MFNKPKIAWLSVLAMLGACHQASVTPVVGLVVPDEPAAEWLGLVTPSDLEAINAVGEVWSTALKEAKSAGFGDEIAAEGSLLDPAASLGAPAPTPGTYQCRIVRLGNNAKGQRAFQSYKPFFCFVGVSEGHLTFTKQTGSDRPTGFLYPDDQRMIFLGSMAFGPDDEPLAYGGDTERDLAGVFERIGYFRFRIVVPNPPNGSRLGVIELVVSEAQPE